MKRVNIINMHKSLKIKKIDILYFLVFSLVIVSVKFVNPVFAQEYSCTATYVCWNPVCSATGYTQSPYFASGVQTSPACSPGLGSGSYSPAPNPAPSSCTYQTTQTYDACPGDLVLTDACHSTSRQVPVTVTGSCGGGSCGTWNYDSESTPYFLNTAQCGEIESIESACNQSVKTTPPVPIIATTSQVCSNGPYYECGQTFQDICSTSPNSVSYKSQCFSTQTTTWNEATTVGADPSSAQTLPNAHSTTSCTYTATDPSHQINIRQGCTYEAVPYQAMNPSGNPVPQGSACKNPDDDQIHNVNLAISGNGLLLATASATPQDPLNILGLPSNIANYSTQASQPGTINFGLEATDPLHTAPHGIKDLKYFVGIYYDKGGSLQNWTLIKNLGGSVTPGTTAGGVNVADGGFLNGTQYADYGPVNNWLNTYVWLTSLSNVAITDIMTQHQGSHVAVIWGVKGVDNCDITVSAQNMKNDYATCSNLEPVVPITTTGSTTGGPYKDLNSVVNNAYQVMIFDRAPEGVIVYTPSRDNTAVGQGDCGNCTVYSNLSANMSYNYFNHFITRIVWVVIIIEKYGLLYSPLPLNQTGPKLTAGQDYTAPQSIGTTDTGLKTPGITDNNPITASEKGYGPSTKYPNVGNPVDYTIYFRGI